MRWGHGGEDGSVDRLCDKPVAYSFGTCSKLAPCGRFRQLNFAQKLYALAKKINTRGKGLREKTRIKMKVLAVGEW